MRRAKQSSSSPQTKKSFPALDESCIGPLGDLRSSISYLPLGAADLQSILTSTRSIGSSWLSSHPIWEQGMSSFQWACDKWSCYRHIIEVTRAITEGCEMSFCLVVLHVAVVSWEAEPMCCSKWTWWEGSWWMRWQLGWLHVGSQLGQQGQLFGTLRVYLIWVEEMHLLQLGISRCLLIHLIWKWNKEF